MFFSYLIALTLFDTAVAVPLTANSAKAVPRPRNSVVYISFINNTFLIRNTLYVVHGFPSALYTKLGSFFWHFLSPCFHCYVLPKRMFIPKVLRYVNHNIDNHIQYVYTIFITFVRFWRIIMKRLPQISEAEFEVMKIVWKHAPISTNEITEKLLQTTSWSPKTIQTLIKRLVTKGALTYEKQSRVFVYTPLVKENEYIGQESSSFLNRFYNGDITAMLSAFLENNRLSETEIERLRSLLTSKSPKGDL